MKRRLLTLLIILIISVLAFSACDKFFEHNPPDEYTVTFETNGGTAIDPIVVTRGSLVERPADPVKGYDIFDGWFTDEEFTRPWNFDADIVNSPLTIYAKWIDHVHSGGNATCTAKPVCDVCGEEYGTTKEHVVAKDAAVDPTCTTTGLTEGAHCDVCGTVLKAQEIIPTVDHTYDDEYDEKCNVCGFERDVACRHTETVVVPGYAATCTTPGLTDGEKCANANCGEIIVAQEEIPAIGHSYKSEITTPATCEGNGVKTYTCEHDATHTYTEEIPAIGHDWNEGEITTAPNCETEGVKTYICKNDANHTKTETVSATGHKDSGTGHCEVCGKSLCAVHKEATEPKVDPTCTEAGKTERIYCSVCGDTIKASETIPATGHSYKSTVTAPTCTEGGYTTHTCHCGDSYVDSRVDALGHKYESVVTKPTCKEDGYTTHTCSVCNDTYTDSKTAATGHKYGEWEVSEETDTTIEYVRACACGDEEHKTAYKVTVYFKNTYNWTTVNTYSWIEGKGDQTNAWPGNAATKLDNGWWSYSMVVETTDNLMVIFNNGNGGDGNQTANLTYNASKLYWVNNTAYATMDEANNASVTHKMYLMGNINNWTAKEEYLLTESEDKATWTITVDFKKNDEFKIFNSIGNSWHSNNGTNNMVIAKDGKYLITYTVKGNKITVEDVTPHVCEYTEEITTAPTCMTEGLKTFTCECGESYTEAIPVDTNAHNYVGTVTTQPSCTENGVKTYTCSHNSEHTYTEPVTKLGHIDEDGNNWCDRCKNSLCGDDHKWIDATCEAPKTCSKCGTVEGEALGHTPAEAVKENEKSATCTEGGSYDIVVYCSVCKTHVISKETVTVNATGHKYGDEVKYEETDTTIEYRKTCECGHYESRITHKVTLYYYTTEWTKVNLYAWFVDPVTNTWPGSAMTAVEGQNGLFSITLELETTEGLNIIFNSENGQQTSDLKYNGLNYWSNSSGYATLEEAIANYQPPKHLVVYLVPNAEWKQDNARFAVYLFGNGDTWVSMTEIGNTDVYTAEIPSGYTGLIFCRMNPSTTANNWDNKWSQTVDLKVPTDDNVCFTMKAGSWDNGSWGVYAEHVCSYTKSVTAPTCTESGYTTYTCECGKSYVADEVTALGHSYKSEITTPATCEGNGVKTYTCEHDATHTYTEEIPAIGHDWNEGVTTKAPTCSEFGVMTYTCKHNDDHKKTEDISIDENAHDWNEGVITKAPTCSELGVMTYTCKHNDEHKKTEDISIDENAHDWNEGVITKAPTCSEDGVMTYTCKHNETHTYEEKIDALNHIDKDNNNVCDREDCKQPLCHPGNHKEGEGVVTTPATCVSTGVMTYTCTACGTTRTETIAIDKDNHTIVKHDAKAPTCTEIGWKAYETCSNCDYTTYEEIKANGHSYVDHDAKAPTCTEIGWNAYKTCSECDYTTYEEIKANGHSYVDHDAKAPTCTEIGWNAYKTCSECDYTTYEEIKANGHSYVKHDAKAPACEEVGFDAYETCENCDYSTYNEIPAIGHDWDDGIITTPATATTAGVKTYTCKNDGAHTKEETVNFVVYLEPSAEWLTSGSRFAIYFYGENDIFAWTNMSDADDDGIYEADILYGYTNLIFVCMNNNAANDWNNKVLQTKDLALTENVNCYRIIDDGGVWFTHPCNHNFTEVTCTSDSVCTICGKVQTVAPGHVWAEEVWTVVIAPTTDADGIKSRECSVCGTVTEVILRKEEVKPMLYLTPNANWKVDGARFAAYFFGNGEKWVNMTYNSKLGVYEVEVPAGYPNVIFCRMNPSATANNWNNKWNQTADLKVPTNGTNHYTVKAGTWDKGGGTWTTTTPKVEHECVYYPATCTAKMTCYQCGATYGEALPHVDADKDHNCDYNCGKTFSTHVAAEGTHVCEYCGGVVTQCADNDNDHNCDVCGDKLSEHTPAEAVKENIKNPTCTVDGSYDSVVYCSICLTHEISRKTIVVSATGHNPVTDKAVAPTCTATGLTEGSHCSVCNETLVKQTVVDALGHAKTSEYKVIGGALYLVPTCGCESEKVSVDTTKAVPARNEADLKTVLTNGFDVVLEANIDLTSTIELSGITATIDLNGKTLKADWESDGVVEVLHIHDGSHVTIIGEGNVVSGGNYTAATNSVISCRIDSTLTIKGGNYYSASHGDVIFCETRSIVYIEGGNFQAENAYLETWYVLDIDETEDNETRGKFVVTGGTFVSFDPANHTNDRDYTNKLAEGYHSIKSGNVYAVSAHGYKATVTDPDCVNKGFTTHTCVCGDSYIDTYVDALGHDYKSVVTKPTCVNGGYTTYTCSVCEHSYVADHTDALGHDYKAVVTAPTCTTDGYTTYTCSVCGDTYVDTKVAAKGHVKGEAVIEKEVKPTCETKGSYETVVYCTVCGVELDRTTAIVSKLGHTVVVDKAVAPTCEGTGLTEGSHCSVCNKVLVAQVVVPATNHNYKSEVTTPAGCETTGLKVYTCQNDNSHTYSETIPETGHTDNGKGHCSVCGKNICENHVEAIEYGYAATCTTDGKTDRIYCGICGVTIKASDVITAYGHSYTPSVTAPTCEEQGYTTHTCRCGDYYVDTYVDAIGHNYTEAYGMVDGELVLVHTCQNDKTHSYNTDVDTSKAVPAGNEADLQTVLTNGYSVVLTANIYLTSSLHLTTKMNVVINLSGNTIDAAWDDETGVVDVLWAQGAGVVVTITGNGTMTCTGNGGSTCVVSATDGAKVVIENGRYASNGSACIYATRGGVIEILDGEFSADEVYYGNRYLLDVNEAEELGTIIVYGGTFHNFDPANHTNDGEYTDKLAEGYHSTKSGDVYVVSKHEYKATVTDPNCVDKGYTTHTCDCGHSYVDTYVDALKHIDENDDNICDRENCEFILCTDEDHISDGGVVTTPATCVAAGVRTYSCSACGKELRTEEIPVDPNAHNIVEMPSKPMTCTEDGHSVYDACTLCDYEDGKNIIKSPGHFFKIDIAAKAATCTEDGYTATERCLVCDYTKGNETIPALGHKYKSVVTDPTCTEEGYTTHTCENCNHSYVDTTVSATGHNIVTDKAVAPTCTETGLTEGSHCSVCDEVFVAQDVVDALGHDEYDLEEKAATCEEDGSEGGTGCHTCGEIVVAPSVITALGHKHTNGNVICDNCGLEKQESWTLVTNVSQLVVGGKVVIVAKNSAVALSTTQNTNNRGQAAVTKNGNNVTFGSNVQILTLQSGNTTGTWALHTGSGYLYAAGGTGKNNYLKTTTSLTATSSWNITITSAGVATIKTADSTVARHTLMYNSQSSLFSCYASGQAEVVLYMQNSGYVNHVHTEKTLTGKAATCTENGLTEGKQCTVCGEVTVAQTEVPATGHNYVIDTAVAPTCQKTGLTEGTHCANGCGIGTVAQVEVPVIECNFVNGVCTMCGVAESHVCTPAEAVKENNVDPTCTEKGGYDMVVYCEGCGEKLSTEHVDVEATDHNFEDGKCTKCGEKDPAAPVIKEITFNLGANGTASHYDGTSKTTYSETVDGYTFKITTGSTMYTGARDAKGNSCIKFGSSSNAGLMSFAVPQNVNKVVIYIAGYKANTAKIKVNNVSYTITTLSNNGAYTAIEVDTSTNKVIAFTTVSGGYRAMVNSIVFFAEE